MYPLVHTHSIQGHLPFGRQASRRLTRGGPIYGKKRIKRRIVPLKPNDKDVYEGSAAEYLKFGSILGDSPEESLETLKERTRSDEVSLDPKTQSMFEKLQQIDDKKNKEQEMIRKVAKGELDWQETKVPKPIWAKSKKFVQANNRMEKLLFNDEEEDEVEEEAGSLYGRFLLENEEEIPDDFTYEDFEAMIAELPANMVEEKEDMEDFLKPRKNKSSGEQIKKAPKLAARPRSKYLKDKPSTATPKPKQRKKDELPKPKKAPKLKQPRMKSVLFPEQEEEHIEEKEEVVKKIPAPDLNPRPKLRQ